MALGLFLTLLLNTSKEIFQNPKTIDHLSNNYTLFYQYNFFSLGEASMEVNKFIAVILMALVVIGWKPRITCLLHTWIALSFVQIASTPDGGDQVGSLFSILLLPICLTDNRNWHWGKDDTNRTKSFYAKSLCISTFRIIRIQVSVIYLHAATSKFRVNEWLNGTAIWYWFKDPIFGYNEFMNPIFYPILDNPYLISFTTWLVLAIELFLFMGLMTDKKYWGYLLAIGICFHFMILIIHGLFSFFCSMAGALILYLKPNEEWIKFKKIRAILPPIAPPKIGGE